jgi:hypothetical protein
VRGGVHASRLAERGIGGPEHPQQCE